MHKEMQWSRALYARTQPTPHFNDVQDTEQISSLQQQQRNMTTVTDQWSPAYIIDHRGQQWFHNFLPRREASMGLFLVQRTIPTRGMLRYPIDNQYVRSPPVAMLREIDMLLDNAVRANIHQWQDCFHADEIQRIQDIRMDLARDENFASIGSSAHRPRRDQRRTLDHVKISVEGYNPIVRRFLEAGFTIQFVPEGKPSSANTQITKPEDWGFSARALQAAARAIEWLDKELIAFLTFGGYGYSVDTPPISWFAPHSISVYNHWQALAASVHKEIRNGWMQGPYNFIPTVPFRIVPGAAIPKP